nr:ammonium transporter [Bacillus velezensis]
MQMGDTVFMFFCALLVWLMTPGLALFYGGMVKSKNVLSTAMHSFSSLAIVSVVWVLYGYSLAFAPGNTWLGGIEWAGLKGVGFEPGSYSDTIPHSLFMMFQMTFAVLTTAIISGAFAERMRFSAFLVFSFLWASLVYTPVAHWVWGGGWIGQMGALDFAGGNVVHISSGVAGLVLAIVLGKRKDGTAASPHNLIYTFLGGALIWFGWFGFNVGGALTLDSIAMFAFINTNTAAIATGIIGWILIEWMLNKKPTMLGAVSGAIAGLVAITPVAGFVTPFSSIVIGFIGGLVCFWGVYWLKKTFGYDDALDAFGPHGIGGTWGGIATGLFATTSVNDGGANGLFYGDPGLLWKQIAAIAATYVFVFIVTFVIIKIVGLFIPLRASEEEESLGLDLTMHGEKAYQDL